jgi:hypothetical protein
MIKWFINLFRKETKDEKIIQQLKKGGYPPYNDKNIRRHRG